MTNGEKPRRREPVRSEEGTPSDRAVWAEQAMAQLAAIIEFTDDAIIGLTLDGTVVSWNPGAERVFGHTGEESLGRHVSALLPPDRREEANALLDRAAGGSAVAHYETVGLRKDGQAVHLSVTISPLKNRRGRLVGACAIARDVTRRVLAEQAAAAAQQRTMLALEAAQAGTWELDLLTGALRGSGNLAQPFGTSPEALRTGEESLLRRVHPDDRVPLRRAITHAVARGDEFEVEFRVLQPDGDVRWHAARGTVIRDSAGRPASITGVDMDVTQRRRDEETRRQSERQFRAIFHGAAIGMARLDADGRFLESNQALQQMLGYTAKQLEGCRFVDFFHADDAEASDYLFDQMKAGVLDFYQMEHRFIRSDEEIIWGGVTVTVIRDYRGRIEFGIGMVEDNTDRRMLEEQFRQSQKMEAIGRLAGGVAHDFNNMLAVITGYSELLLHRSPPDAATRSALEEIRSAGERAGQLTRQLLAFSRKQVVHLQDLNLNDFISHTQRMLRRVIGEDVDLAVSLQPDLWTVKADPSQMNQVLLNLVVNARDAMPHGGRLTIETRNLELHAAYTRGHPGVKPGQYVLMAVTDTGGGMTEAIRNRIFDPFFTTKAEGEGTGLGLSTVYGIVKQSGGHIHVYSEPGHGSSFKIYLPRVGSGSEAVRALAEETSPGDYPGGTETVLLVEDDRMVRVLTRGVLEECGYRVLEAARGDEALRIVEEHAAEIELLLSDVVMPGGISGRMLAEELERRFPRMRVILMSGYSDDAVVRHGVITQTVHFIQKPFTPRRLAEKVREVLDG